MLSFSRMHSLCVCFSHNVLDTKLSHVLNGNPAMFQKVAGSKDWTLKEPPPADIVVEQQDNSAMSDLPEEKTASNSEVPPGMGPPPGM